MAVCVLPVPHSRSDAHQVQTTLCFVLIIRHPVCDLSQITRRASHPSDALYFPPMAILFG